MLQAYLSKDPQDAQYSGHPGIHGLQFVRLRETAWDLALTTQALTYVDRDLALAISRVGIQKSSDALRRGMTQAMYVFPVEKEKLEQVREHHGNLLR